MNRLTYKPIVISLLYLHMLVMFVAVPRQSEKYAAIKANILELPVDALNSHWIYSSHWIIAGIVILATIACLKIKDDDASFIPTSGLVVNLGLTVYWISSLF